MWGGGILKNNNLKSSQNNDVLIFNKNLQNQNNIKNQANIKTPIYIKILRSSRIINSHKIINILKETVVSNNQKDIKNQKVLKPSKYANSFAFSLIELSIVLIIIGLLVAGVTGGKSLIESAKIRALYNEANSWKQAVSIFYVAKDRLPGDLNNDGAIGFYIKYDGSECFNTANQENYTSSSFSGYSNPHFVTAPFIDLALEKVIDFVPEDLNFKINLTIIGSFSNNSGCYLASNSMSNYKNVLPNSKIYKDLYWSTFFTIDDYPDGTKSPLNSSSGNGVFILLNNPISKKDIKKPLMQKIDTKFDDGETYTGTVRSVCNQGIANFDNFYIASNGAGKYNQRYISNDYCEVALFEVWKK